MKTPGTARATRRCAQLRGARPATRARDVARVVRIAKLGLEIRPEQPDGVFLFVVQKCRQARDGDGAGKVFVRIVPEDGRVRTPSVHQFGRSRD